MSGLSSAVLLALSEWIDGSPGYVGCSPETVLWRRVSKASMEANEALDALSGMVGENPRKGVYATEADVIRELLDTATAALGAIEHMTGRGDALEMLDQHIVAVGVRAGLLP